MSVIRQLNAKETCASQVFIFVERASGEYYHFAAMDTVLDRRSYAANRLAVADIEPFAPPFFWGQNVLNTSPFTEPLIRLAMRDLYTGSLLELSPIPKGFEVQDTEPFAFPGSGEVSFTVADPVNEDTGVNPLRSLRWTGAKVYIGLYVEADAYLYSGAFEGEIPPTGGAVTLFVGEVADSASGEDTLTLSCVNPFAVAFNELRCSVEVTPSRFPNAEDSEVGKRLPIIYGVHSARVGRRRSGGAVQLVPLNGGLPEDDEARNTLWGVASHPIGHVIDVWVEDRDRVRRRVLPADYAVETVSDTSLLSLQPSTRRTSAQGAYTVLRFVDGLELPVEDDTPLSEYTGNVYVDVVGKVNDGGRTALRNPMDVVMDFIEVHTDALLWYRGFTASTPFGTPLYNASWNTAHDIRQWYTDARVQAAGVVEGDAKPQDVLASLFASFGLRMMHTQGQQSVGSWRCLALEFGLFDAPVNKAWRARIAEDAHIVPFSREHRDYAVNATGREWWASDTEHLSNLQWQWDDANQVSIMRVEWLRDWTSPQAYGAITEVRHADYVGITSALETIGTATNVLRSNWIRDSWTADWVCSMYLWRYALPVQTLRCEAPLREVCFDAGYGVQLYTGRMSPAAKAFMGVYLTGYTLPSIVSQEIHVLDVQSLWAPGEYLTANSTDYATMRAVLGDEAALPSTWGAASGEERYFAYLIDDGKRLGVEPR